MLQVIVIVLTTEVERIPSAIDEGPFDSSSKTCNVSGTSSCVLMLVIRNQINFSFQES